MKKRRLLFTWIAMLLAVATMPAQTNFVVGPVPERVRLEFKLDPFYQKYASVGSLPIVGSTNATDFALREAVYIVEHMLAGRDDIIGALAERRAKVVVMAHNEYTTDLPEQRDMEPKVYWDSRARGMGGRTCSCAEENLLCYPGDPYAKENIFIHEFAHVIHGVAMRKLDPSFDKRLETAYADAMKRGLWRDTYASVDAGEYWAESVQDWFDNNRRNDSLHNSVSTRAELKSYDPAVARLCAEVFGENPWRYKKPMDRDAAGRAHLGGFDPAKSPRFHWRTVPAPEKPQVRFETGLGEFTVELDAKAAPITVGNFLKYAHERLYNDGRFFRTVTPNNQPTNNVKIQVVQAEAGAERVGDFFPPIPLERTRDTGLRHLHGTLSMARNGPDTAQDSFSICIGDQPELDFGGKRNPDGQGFAAFGKVVEGMDVVQKIHASQADGQLLAPPINIKRAIRLN
jgi:cyclophilin family peptidyl-prolyl cis-trans isomerase